MANQGDGHAEALIASAGLVLAGGVADAQRPGASYPAPGTAMQVPMARPARPGPIAAQMPVVQAPTRPIAAPRSSRWGSKIGGRWWAGANAPGGWAGYRRPHRGWVVPAYWNAPRFYVGDWSNYGLAQPPQGYNWVRYYDDAVLIDARGSVYDTTSDIDWDLAGGGGYVAADPRAYARNDNVYASPSDRGYVQPYANRPAPRRDTGLGGAAIGAVAGGVAGNVIGGRGNRPRRDVDRCRSRCCGRLCNRQGRGSRSPGTAAAGSGLWRRLCTAACLCSGCGRLCP
ncbi:RcnB family protein [Sphingomonas sp. 22L2VL55-3]